MAMSKGSVTIDPETGEDSGDGAAYALFQVMDGKQDYQDLTGASLAAAKQLVADVCESFAELIDYIKTNAEVSTTTSGTATSVTAGGDTAPTSGTGVGTIS